MSVMLRLSRHGSKKQPLYRVVAIDKRQPRDGGFIERLGTYNPLFDPPEVTLKWDRIEHWLAVGARPSGTVASLLKKFPKGYVRPERVKAAVPAPTARPVRAKPAPAPVSEATEAAEAGEAAADAETKAGE